MDRTLLEQHVEHAREHVASGEKHVIRQRELVVKLERDGKDASAAWRLLAQFEELLSMHAADCDRLETQLAKSRLPTP